MFPKKVVICAAAAVALVSVSCSNQNKHGDRAEDWPGHWTRSNDPHTNITLSRHHSLQSTVSVMKLQSSLLVSDGSGCWWWQRRVGGTINRTKSWCLLSRYLHCLDIYVPSRVGTSTNTCVIVNRNMTIILKLNLNCVLEFKLIKILSPSDVTRANCMRLFKCSRWTTFCLHRTWLS